MSGKGSPCALPGHQGDHQPDPDRGHHRQAGGGGGGCSWCRLWPPRSSASSASPARPGRRPSAATAKTGTSVATGAVAPNSANELDCNGWSPKYHAIGKEAGALCTDPIKILNGKATRFSDNGWYVGHDEPSVKFISSRPGSGNTMTYVMKLPRDPKKAPTANGKVVDYAQLSPAPWFGLPICDPKSYPQNPCKPDSDTNSGTISDPNSAGSAFMELQFYPPGFTPAWTDNISCNATKWCAAMTIHLPRRVQHGQAAEPGALGRARGRRAHAAGDRPRRGLQRGGEPAAGR